MEQFIDVLTSSGRLRGTRVERNGVGLARFLGVPYAKPPTGDLRWRPPQPPDPWTGVRDATAFGPDAPQLSPAPNSLYAGGENRQSEDCLTLNVWGATEDVAERPVLVWLHLGAFQFGSASNPLYDGERLAAAGATVVTVNYRLGRLGFLAHPVLSSESEDGTSGNYGLLDQIQALRWVQENITSFGGDPDCVTLVGCSAGAHSIYCLRSSPLARGLFHRAIAHSGLGFSRAIDGPGHPAAIQTLAAAEEAGLELTGGLGVRNAAELRALSVEAILTEQLDRGTGPWHLDFLPPEVTVGDAAFDTGYPIVDGHVLPRSPREVFTDGEQIDVPMLAGSTGNESSGLPFLESLSGFRAMAQDTFGDRGDDVLRLYPATSDNGARRASADLYADRMFTWATWMAVRLHAQTGTAPVHLFRFVHEPPLPPDADIAERDNARAFHGAEIPYLFGTFTARNWPWTDTDYKLGKTLSATWLRFARTGDPNGAGLPHWPRFTQDHRALVIGPSPALIDVPDRERLAFWDDFYHAWHAILDAREASA